MKRALISIILLAGGAVKASELNPVIQSIAKSAQEAMFLYCGEKVEISNYVIWYQGAKDDYFLVLMKDGRIVKVAPRVMSLGAWVNNPKLSLKNEYEIPTEMVEVFAKSKDIGDMLDTVLRSQPPDNLPWMIDTGEIAKITILNIQSGTSLVIPVGLPGKWNQSPWKTVIRWVDDVSKAHRVRLGSWGKIPDSALPNCLIWAVVNNRADEVRRLLSCGADIRKAEALLGDSLEETAKERGNTEIAALIARWKAQP